LNKKNEVLINSKNSVDALQLMADMIHKHKIVPSGITTYQEEESREVFTSGNACFHRNWPYVWAIVQDEAKKSKVENKIGVVPLPHFPGGRSSACLGGWNLAISEYSKNKDTAWKFIEFMTSYEAQKIYAIKGGRLPTREKVYRDSEVLKFAPHYEQLYRCFITARPRPISPDYSKISDTLQVELHKALTLRKSPQQALDYAKTQIEKILKE
jgi:multiple sugar transport system substrate-binding protein